MKLPPQLYFILVLFIILTGVYSNITPYRQGGILRYQGMQDPVSGQMVPQTANDIGAPDERQHANYIQHLKDGKGFPKITLNDPNMYENYQAHQPPLYYLLGAGWATITNSDAESTGAGFKLRFLNSIIGVAGLLAIYFSGIWGLQRKDIALAATAFAAFLPMNISLHAAITNDPLLFCLVSWAFAFTLKSVQQGWNLKDSLVIAVFVGLALLTKTSALVCIPVTLAAIIISSRRTDSQLKANLVPFIVPLLLPFVIAAPWFIRNKSLYGDFLAVSVFNSAFTGSPQASTFIDGLGANTYWLNMVTWWTARSFVGAFGYMDIFLFDSMESEKAGALYVSILVLIGTVILYGISHLKQYKIEAEEQALPEPKVFAILLFVLLSVTLVLFVRFNTQYFQGQARYLFPAIVSFSYLFAFGSVKLLKNRPDLGFLVPTIFLGLLNLAAIQAMVSGFPMRQT